MTHASRRGFALAAALLALTLIAALVAGVFFATMEETRVGAAVAERQLALAAAESAIETIIGDWNVREPDTTEIAQTRSSPVVGLGVAVTVYVTRFDPDLCWIVADAGETSVRSEVGRRIGALVRVKTALDGSITVDRVSERWWSELF
ncbi:MAG TPA: PilX N-terminal domain-containing pilus assembly protein [Gemmatimonadaceae bacterium]